MTSEHYAKAIRQAYLSKVAIAPLSPEIGVEDLELAYQIQEINTKYWMENGAKIIGKKIGLTSKIVQTQLGVDQPDYGILFDNMSVPDGGMLSVKKLIQPKAEVEIAFVLRKNLDLPDLTLAHFSECIDYAVAAIEIVDSRIENWNIKITDTIADNASASHYVIGSSRKKINEFDLERCKMKLYKNGTLVSEGLGANCLGSPLNSTLWLANKMMELGQPLQAGELIFTGALGPMVNVTKDDHLEAEIEGLGEVVVSFGE